MLSNSGFLSWNGQMMLVSAAESLRRRINCPVILPWSWPYFPQGLAVLNLAVSLFSWRWQPLSPKLYSSHMADPENKLSWFFDWLYHSLNKYLLSTYYVPGTRETIVVKYTLSLLSRNLKEFATALKLNSKKMSRTPSPKKTFHVNIQVWGTSPSWSPIQKQNALLSKNGAVKDIT